MHKGDWNYIRNLNRRVILEEIVKNASLSRSELARITGLNKATISTQINDLLEQGLVIETRTEALDTPGRKPIIIEMNERAGFTIGVDIDELSTNIIFCDLKGRRLHQKQLHLDTYHFESMLDELIQQLQTEIDAFQSGSSAAPLAGIGIGIHGIVNNDSQIVYTPKQEWVNLDVKTRLEEAFDAPVHVDNSANLAVYAEHVYAKHGSDLFCLTLYSGIGLGMVKDSVIYRGHQGFAGEIGHMIIEPDGKPCPCGNHGCWELYASNKAFFKLLHESGDEFHTQDQVSKHLETMDAEQEIAEYIYYLSIGVNNVINIFNPERIIINSPLFASKPDLLERVEASLQSKFNNYEQLKISSLNEDACALGAAALAFKKFLGVHHVDHSASFSI
ncbi:ROK family transcriptional regulator [Marinococcus halotolerans]|uniref:ROK family transcriptional regulator n=1 Tax=Marinococcus halotolerans TaxID=301092 RepID=UPI0003B51CE4|nr:ROK family transcriptional regulator [Marinococcus halotolerans]